MADAETKELSRELADSRNRLSWHTTALAERANFPRRIRQSVTRKPAVWISAAVVIGVLIAVVRPRKRRVEIREVPAKESQTGKAALAFSAAKIAFDLFRPSLTAYFRNKVAPSVR